SLTVPSANSYVVSPSCLTPSFSSSSEGAIESVAPVSTRNKDSNDFFGSSRFVSLVVTFVNPIAAREYHRPEATAARAQNFQPLMHTRLRTLRRGKRIDTKSEVGRYWVWRGWNAPNPMNPLQLESCANGVSAQSYK